LNSSFATHAAKIKPRKEIGRVSSARRSDPLSKDHPATLASAMSVLSDLLACLPTEFSRSQPFAITLERLTGLAEEICGECVPHAYTPRLVFWMDRIQATARRIK
jgi:hypothetical protein